MKLDDFLYIMNKVLRFKTRLEQEGITGQQLLVILKVYISDLTNRINIAMLEVV